MWTAFEKKKITQLTAKKLGLDPEMTGLKKSPTKIINVYTPTMNKKNIILKGTAKKIVSQIFERFDDKIGGAIGKDLKVEEDS